MTDKVPTIICGVDVKDCEYYYPKCRNKCEGIFKCESKPNCYFKQLQRKTQEYNSTLQENVVLLQLYSEKEREYEDLQNASFTLAEGLDIRQNKLDRYKQALEKIEEFINSIINEDKDPKIFKVANPILRRIYEVKNV